MRTPRTLLIHFAWLVLLTLSPLAKGGTWTPLNNQPTFFAGTALLLTDGTVIVQEISSSYLGTGNWWKLTPDNTGSYVNGTWSALASMPSGYAPLYYASAVLPDGRVVVEGGEYNGNNNMIVETNLGAIYDPASNTWTAIAAPTGWTYIGDGQSVVLPNGTFMLGNCGYFIMCTANRFQQALLNASTLTWTITGTGKADQNAEEGWTLLPNGKVLTVDVWNGTESELYQPSTGKWSLAGKTPVTLVNTMCGEIGPAVLRPDGSVFASGATSSTATYFAGTWSSGPAFPMGYGVDDGPAAILPDGNVLVGVSPIPVSPCSVYPMGSKFYEYDGSAPLISVPAPPNAPFDATFFTRMLVLPTGQILFTDASTDVEIYTASGTYQSAWQPRVAAVASALAPGSTNNAAFGWQFNGLSQGAMYGDDVQTATNYPLVRIKNNATGHVFYCKTHDHSTMGVATGSLKVSTEFDVPSSIETGGSTLEVVANGIPSSTVSVNITATAAGFATTGSMNTARDLHTSTLLQSGSTLIAGGQGSGGVPVASAELYNAGTFAFTGSLIVARYRHTATLLQTGSVLIAGGNGGGGPVTPGEVYNSTTGTFGLTGNLVVPRYAHTATLLPSGLVLVTGGLGSGGTILASAELYNPTTRTFTLTGTMNAARYLHTATLLPSGKVLIAGGFGIGAPQASAELYDPSTGTFTLTGNMNTARYLQTATLLKNGLVLVAGGSNGTTLASAELYNPATAKFTVTARMNGARQAQTATLLSSGSVLVAGGYNSVALASAELYNPTTGRFTLTGSLHTPRDGHAATLLQSGSVLVTGGFNTTYLASAELFTQ